MRRSPLKHSAEKEMWLWLPAQNIPPAPPIRQKKCKNKLGRREGSTGIGEKRDRKRSE